MQEKGFLDVAKEGKNNIYSAIISKEIYMQTDSKNMLKKLYKNSVKNFLAALYDGNSLSEKDLQELEEYIEEKRRNQ